MKVVIGREPARRDIAAAIAHYVAEASFEAAVGFADALEHAITHIGRHPSAGSPRFAEELGLPGLRTRQLKRYPYLIFYFERNDHVDVWRVLHVQRDIGARLHDDDT